MDRKTLILIDASALIYRAYYALPPLTTKDGMLVNAMYGFTSALFNAIRSLHPEYIVVAFDSKTKTFRHRAYKEYKANRPKAPKELTAQIPLAREVCHMLNIPHFEAPGFEADDLIGAITQELATYNLQLTTIIVTGDMDTLQLVDDNTQVYSMARGINKAVIYDEKKVQERYGFLPEFIVDYKALRGDPSDNIPGVPGVGEKTATELIKNFGHIENLYKQILNSKFETLNKSEFLKFKTSNKLRELLIKYRKQAILSKHLATINVKAPVRFKLGDCKIHDYDQAKAIKFFQKLGFKSLIARLPKEEKNHQQDKLF